MSGLTSARSNRGGSRGTRMTAQGYYFNARDGMAFSSCFVWRNERKKWKKESYYIQSKFERFGSDSLNYAWIKWSEIIIIKFWRKVSIFTKLLTLTGNFHLSLHALWYIRVFGSNPVLDNKGIFGVFEYSIPLHPP